MIAIFKKELLSCFRSVIGWLFLSVSTFFASLFFIIFNMFGGYPYVSYVLNGMVTVLMFILPVLTMRIISEEKRQKSDQLLLTAPVSPFMVVLGKYLALVTIFIFSCVPELLYPLFMRIFGEIPMNECYVSVLGYILYGVAAISIGMFISSITDKQIVAIIVTYLAFLGMALIPQFVSVFLPASNWVVKVLSIMDITGPTQNFFSGMLELTDVLYYLSVIGIFVILTYRSVGKQTFSVSTRGIGKVLLSISGTVLVILVIIGCNIGAKYIPEKYTKYDITDNKMYTLTDTTKELVKTLQEDITIYVLADKNDYDTIVGKYLSSYDQLSDKVHVEYRSFTQSPYFYKDYTDEQPEQGSLIIVYKDANMVIPYSEMYVHDSGFDYTTGQYYDNVSGINVEGRVTAAISAFITGDIPTLYVIEGHEEVPLNNYITSALSQASYQVQNIKLVNMMAIPDNVDLVIVNAPKYDFNEEDIDKIKQYIANGGNGLFTLSSVEAETPVYDAFLESYGISIAKGVVMEGNVNYVYQNMPYAILPDVISNDITKNIGNRYAFCVFSKGIVVPESTDSIGYESLLLSSDSAYCKTNLASTTTAKEEGDIDGPFAFAVSIDLLDSNKTSKMVVIAPDQFTSQDYDSLTSHANSDLVLGSIKVASQTELTSAIAAKSMNYENLSFGTGTVLLYGLLFIVVVPMGLLAVGIAIWAYRKKK